MTILLLVDRWDERDIIGADSKDEAVDVIVVEVEDIPFLFVARLLATATVLLLSDSLSIFIDDDDDDDELEYDNNAADDDVDDTSGDFPTTADDLTPLGAFF